MLLSSSSSLCSSEAASIQSSESSLSGSSENSSSWLSSYSSFVSSSSAYASTCGVTEGDACCGDCYGSFPSQGTLNIACSVNPDAASCGAMDCSALTGNCTYNETAKRTGANAVKVCGADCDSAGLRYVYDYASDNCE